MESGLFIFHISNCLLCLFVCYIKVPGFSWRPTFRCLSLAERRRARGRRGSLHGTKTLMFIAYVSNFVNTSYIHVKQTQHSFNLHIIHHPSAIHKMYSRWSKGREVDIGVQTAGTSSRVSTAPLYPGDGDAARVIVNILGINTICQALINPPRVQFQRRHF